MSFSGNLEDFPVMDVMQYVHASRASGSLHFEDGEQRVQLDFRAGEMIRAARPGMTNLGSLLLEQGRITPRDLEAALRIQKESAQPQPIGMILNEMGVIDRHALREGMLRQIEEVLFELISWKEGSFHFEPRDSFSPNDLSFRVHDVISPEEIDTQRLLLEMMRLHGDRTEEDPGNGRESALPNQPAGPLPDRNKREAGAEGRCLQLMKQMLFEGRKDGQAQTISAYLLRALAQHLERAVIFLVRRRELLGMGAIGRTGDARSLDVAIKRLRLGLDGDTVICRCLDARSAFCGQPPSCPWLKKLHERIGPPRAPEVVVLPVIGAERTICMVYGDNGERNDPPSHADLLEVIAAQAGLIFENMLLRKQAREENPQRREVESHA